MFFPPTLDSSTPAAMCVPLCHWPGAWLLWVGCSSAGGSDPVLAAPVWVSLSKNPKLLCDTEGPTRLWMLTFSFFFLIHTAVLSALAAPALCRSDLLSHPAAAEAGKARLDDVCPPWHHTPNPLLRAANHTPQQWILHGSSGVYKEVRGHTTPIKDENGKIVL